MAFHNRKNAAATAAAPTTTETTPAAQTAASVEPQTAEQPQPAARKCEGAPASTEHAAATPAAEQPQPAAERATTPARRTKTDRSKLTAEERAAIRERRLARQAEIDALDPAACASILQAMVTAGSITLTDCETTYKATGDTRRVKNEIKRLGGTWTEPIFEADGKTIKEAGYWNLPLDALTDPTTAAQRRLDQRAERAAEREERRAERAAASVPAGSAATPSPFDGLEFWDGERSTFADSARMISTKTVLDVFGKAIIKVLAMVDKTPRDLGSDNIKKCNEFFYNSLADIHADWMKAHNK